jgi:pteridine reductase
VIAFTDIHSMGRPRKDFSAYSMSKAAITEMVYTLARDLGPEVRVNAVAPGVVAWPEEGNDADPDMQRKYVRRIPLGRPGTPDDAAEVVRWLAFDATYLTGEVIRVDGGRWLT